MKLEQIKLSGFKSFAEPTSINVKSNLTAVVGPNGCGKSNIIDAVRWAMGESSAKHLRGGNMADVIFNGSSSRKPLGMATVELIFDNSEGKAGGEYAKYASIAIRRQVNRDGQSQYALNGTRCRRKDITDLFLGTGLGIGSYAIIEQGTISKMVDSKPDELRVYIEEAAGISKYKERRHETHIRIRHTTENLERLEDLRAEVKKQLSSLKKQAKKAQKFTDLKQHERQYKRELLAIRWNNYQQNSEQLKNKLSTIASEHKRLAELLRETDQSITLKRAEQKQQQQHLDTVQADYYHAMAEVSRLQQAIKHSESSHQETALEIEQLSQQADAASSECKQDQQKLAQTKQTLAATQKRKLAIEAQLKAQEAKRESLQVAKDDWQQQWEAYLHENAKLKEKTEVEQVKITHLNQQSTQLQQRLEKLKAEQHELAGTDLNTTITSLNSAIEQLATASKALQQQLATVQQKITQQHQQVKEQQNQLHQNRSDLHPISGKVTSLELLQQHAMGKDKKELVQWLETMELAQNQRLAEQLDVENGWDSAVEVVLNSYLGAILVADISQIMAGLHDLEGVSAAFIQTYAHQPSEPIANKLRLSDKIDTPYDLSGLLAGIYCAPTLAAAIAHSKTLAAGESVITPQGDWMGRDWVKLAPSKDQKSGVLRQAKELRMLQQKQLSLQDQIANLDEQLIHAEQALKTLENEQATLQQKNKLLDAEYAEKSVQLSGHTAKQEQQQQRLNQLTSEIADLTTETTTISKTTDEATAVKATAVTALLELAAKKVALEQQNQALQSEQQEFNHSLDETQKTNHALQAEIDALKATQALTSQQIERLQLQHQQVTARVATLQQKLQATLTPADDEKSQLARLQKQKQTLESTLQTERDKQQHVEAQTTELAEQRIRTQRQIEQQQEMLDHAKFEQQDSQVRQQTISEQLTEIEAVPQQVLDALSATANEQEWKQKAHSLSEQIEQLGPINLTAMEDYNTQSERINFLDGQRDDLLEALRTLEQAISKMDKKSRQRFSETFAKINQGLQEKFPKLFGGGRAYLELTEPDLLETGVNIIARPPGKRNSSIHLLSGGEKALTAVALIFSIFDLSSSSFCLLDEVDAPLDDANVVRFSQMVEKMSETVQFLYISHNKVTLEIAKQLAGVTMEELGVSRMVLVDIDEAVKRVEN